MKAMLLVLVYTAATVGAGGLTIAGLDRLLPDVPLSGKRSIGFGTIFALGSAILATLWQLLALGGQLRWGVVWTVILFFAAAGGYQALSSSSRIRSAFGRVLDLCRADWLIAVIFTTLLLVMGWLAVLAYARPPFGDADAFYFVYSKIVARTGTIAAMAGNYRDFSAVGLSGELHFAALQVIGNAEAAKLFAWVTGIALLVLVADLTKIAGGGGVARILAAAMLVTSTTYSDYLSDGKVDLFPACTGLAAALLLFPQSSHLATPATVLIAGFLTGISVAGKFSYAVVFLPTVGVLAACCLTRPAHHSGTATPPARVAGLLGILLVGLLAGLLPHFLKNYFLFGQPLAPFVGMKANWAEQNWFSTADTIWIVATYPIALVFGQYPMQGGNLSVLWFAALPLCVFLARSPEQLGLLTRPLPRMTVAALSGVLFWLVVKPSVLAPRYMLATLLLLFPLAAVSAERLWTMDTRPRILACGFSFLVMLCLLGVPLTPPAGVWSTTPARVIDHLRKGRPPCGLAISSYCSGFLALNETMREGERVFLAGYYSYFLRHDALQCLNEADDFAILGQAHPGDVWRDLYNKGFAHVAVQKATHGQYLKILDPADAPPWLAVSVDFPDSDMPIFHVRAVGDTQPPEVACVRKGRKSWGLALMASPER